MGTPQSPLYRFEHIIKQEDSDGNWVYTQEWISAGHPHSGLNFTRLMPDSQELTPQQAYDHAVSCGVVAQAGKELLTVWYAGLLQ